MQNYNVVGKGMAAIGGMDVVTGKAVYTPDLEFPRMLVGKLLYSPHASARIVKLDVQKARDLPGVVVVMTADDIPGENSYQYWYSDQPLLVKDQVRYKGDALAAVAAESEEIALAALAAIEVEYELLDDIFDVDEAMLRGSRKVWAEKENIHSHHIDGWGDIEEGFAQADVIVEDTYTTSYQEHAMLETEAAVAYVDSDGTIVIYASAQAPHRDRIQIARALGIPEAMVREITPHIGGAFGGKDEANIQIHAALLANQTRRPVRIVRSREESILTHVKRHPININYKMGATKDGKLTAIHLVGIGDTGPYVNAGEEVMMVMAAYGFTPYAVPHAKAEAYTVLTNNPICGAFRGFGVPQATFAFERQMDELARKLNMDPLEIRILNGLKTGQQFQPQAVVRQGEGMQACLDRVAELSDWKILDKQDRQPAVHLRRGWGLAASFHKVGFGCNIPDHASAGINMAPDGSVLVRTGASDLGQGAHTIIAQFVAEQLGVTPDQVKVFKPDTTLSADAGATVASRVTVFSGNAAINAAEPIRKVLIDLAAAEVGADPDIVDLRAGFVYIENEQVQLTVAELAAKAYENNLPMQASGFYTMDYPDAVLPDGSDGYEIVVGFGVHFAQVLVDIETGQIEIEKIIAVHDVGTVINPKGARGQLEGGVSMAAGYALMEDLVVDQGKIQNPSLESYLIPTIMDVPLIIGDFIEIHETAGPLGAKAIGEPPMNITPAAIANAVTDAIGAPITHLPIKPERVLEILQMKKG
ncbi:MAG: xanthine dehydrogenase family protein [Chloroflexi bacterium]|nr:xanthine dehydrogenase family protein [Chloroflexota bacterium]